MVKIISQQEEPHGIAPRDAFSFQHLKYMEPQQGVNISTSMTSWVLQLQAISGCMQENGQPLGVVKHTLDKKSMLAITLTQHGESLIMMPSLVWVPLRTPLTQLPLMPCS